MYFLWFVNKPNISKSKSHFSTTMCIWLYVMLKNNVSRYILFIFVPHQNLFHLQICFFKLRFSGNIMQNLNGNLIKWWYFILSRRFSLWYIFISLQHAISCFRFCIIDMHIFLNLQWLSFISRKVNYPLMVYKKYISF